MTLSLEREARPSKIHEWGGRAGAGVSLELREFGSRKKAYLLSQAP